MESEPANLRDEYVGLHIIPAAVAEREAQSICPLRSLQHDLLQLPFSDRFTLQPVKLSDLDLDCEKQQTGFAHVNGFARRVAIHVWSALMQTAVPVVKQ